MAPWQACACNQPGNGPVSTVICLGNLTVGGAGKSRGPWSGQLLHAAHERPLFLSRGYGGQLTGPVRANPALHRARDVGDEPLLLARLAPTMVRATALPARNSRNSPAPALW